MPARYFTVEEANALLIELEPLMAELLERRARVVRSRHDIIDILNEYHHNMGSPAASQMVFEFTAIERLTKAIQAYGCVLKDMNAGLLDFLTERNGREVYLCWHYGESRIEYYHELNTGYNGRQRL